MLLSLRDSSSAACEGDRLTALLAPNASRVKDRSSDGDTEDEDDDDDDDEDEDEAKNDDDVGPKKDALKNDNNNNAENDDVSFWAWRLRPAALCELRQYLAFRLAKAALPRRATRGPNALATTAPHNGKNGKRTVNLSHPIPSLLRRLTCTRGGGDSEPLTPATPPSTASSSPASKRPKSLAHRHCLRIRGSQARNLLTAPHPTLGQVFDPARVAGPKPSLPPPSESLLKPFSSTSNSNPESASKTTRPHFRSPSKNGSVSSETEPDSDVPAYGDPAPRLKSSLLSRRPALPPPPPPPQRSQRGRQYGGDGRTAAEVASPFPQAPHVRLLELPAHHQPLLHRYGLSQFVLVLGDQGGESPSSGSPCSSSSSSSSYRNPLRSVMRKPHVAKGSKKSVTFQEVTSVPTPLRTREARYNHVGILSGR